ncbi:MAG: penicillin-binding protein activator [Hyphomicrobiaceae bacterium]|nr:penicillin-binding protein activator [Hyphomicrobiaceae bacterium]
MVENDKFAPVRQDQSGLSRRHLLTAGAGLALGAVSACSPSGMGGVGFGNTTPSGPTTPVLGQGQTRVGLLLPASATGNAGGQVASAFRNAADLAVTELGGNDITLVAKDTLGTPEGARAAAAEALSEGVQMIVGPVFSPEVAAVSQITRPAGVPVIGFSTDATVAGQRTFLLSFLPASDARRVVFYAAGEGKRSIGALLPQNAYGQVMEAELRQAASAANMQVAQIERYELTTVGIQTAAATLGGNRSRYDCVFIPEAGDVINLIVQTLATSGLTPESALFLGSGQWEDGRVTGNAGLVGAVYPGPARAGFEGFAGRYQARFGAPPIRNASLAYDAVTLAALLSRSGGGRIDPAALTNPSGFNGIDGIFRFLSNGVCQRGLAVYKIAGGGQTEVASAAPRSFQGTQF